jgi:Phage integrase, N-terminal SAM-like domain
MMVLDRPLEIGEVPTFAAAVELMLRELEEIGHKPTTLANYRTILGVRLLPRFGEMPVDRVRPAQVEALAAQMIRRHLRAYARQHPEAALPDL